MKQYPIALLVVVGISSGWSADGIRLIGEGKSPQQRPTGNIRVDFFGQTEFAHSPQMQDEAAGGGPAHKSPYLAAGLSLLVPGAGEFYTGRYWEGAVFLVADIAAWALAYSYDKRGDQQTDYYQDYANEHWSPVRYAQWTQDNASRINPTVTGVYVVLNGNGSVNWPELNRLERDIGRWYSHTLPPYGEQQYFELIGKYQQFYQGWDDGDPSLITYAGITQKLESGYTNFTYYSGERGKANSYYNTASTWVTVAIINHVISAGYAALSAGWYNKAHASLGLQQVPVGIGYVRVPVVKISYAL